MIYTKTGDTGTTSLANGERVCKTDPRIDAYGTADELNSYFGWLKALLEQIGEQIPLDEPLSDVSVHIEQLGITQNKLFNLGALLSCAHGEWLTETDVTEVEHWIDAVQAELPPQHAFILPAGSEAIAAAHICRTVTRRLERLMVSLAENSISSESQIVQNDDLAVAIRWVNRLSDYCFVLARKCAILQKKSPVEWKK